MKRMTIEEAAAEREQIVTNMVSDAVKVSVEYAKKVQRFKNDLRSNNLKTLEAVENFIADKRVSVADRAVYKVALDSNNREDETNKFQEEWMQKGRQMNQEPTVTGWAKYPAECFWAEVGRLLNRAH